MNLEPNSNRNRSQCSSRILINTVLQRGVNWRLRCSTALAVFAAISKTAEAVEVPVGSDLTPLKQDVNEKSDVLDRPKPLVNSRAANLGGEPSALATGAPSEYTFAV